MKNGWLISVDVLDANNLMTYYTVVKMMKEDIALTSVRMSTT
jgi:hypothetical protein